MDYSEIKEIATENGLQFVETTKNGNGYPERLRGAVIGFENFEEAQEVAAKFCGEIFVLKKRSGWQLWHRVSHTCCPLSIGERDFSDNHIFINNQFCIEQEFFNEWVKPRLDGIDNFNEMERILKNWREVYEEVCALGDDEVVVTYYGEFDRVQELHPMDFDYDDKYFSIGVVF